MIITRTPYRVSLFGGGTDYPAYYREHGGAVLGFALDKYCYITLRRLPPFFKHRLRLVYSRTEDVRSVDDLEHPAAREVLRRFGWHDGLEIHHDGDLPAMSGMGTSSSFVVGLLRALDEEASQSWLASVATFIEQKALGESVGSQDQVWAAHGGCGVIRFSADGIERELLDPRDLLDHLLLFYTGAQRLAEPLAAALVENVPRRLRHLARMREQVDEAAALLADGRTEDLGPLLDEGWRLKRELADGIATTRADEIYAAARAAGATGGKLLGAGGGGFMLLFAPPERRTEVRRALEGLIEVPVGIDREGSRVVRF